MKIQAYRIVKAKHAAIAFDGEGAKANGGRWNSKGTSMVYTSSSIALAMLEMLAHLGSQDLLLKYVVFPLEFDDKLVTSLDRRKLPKDWKASPASAVVQAIGDTWAASGKSAVLELPSVLVDAESNYLINPLHPDFDQIVIGKKQPIRFDPRLK